ncbi:MAG: hypothetical protein M1368_12930 [Thaumarchaeota archaeon]|nr:hypothetical protein [Nitrososphaerota archaeon]
MRLLEITFGALLSYSPRGNSREMQHSRDVMTALKMGGYVQDPPILMSEWVAQTMEGNRANLPFVAAFPNNAILVPVPSSSLKKEDTLWVPERIASALARRGFGTNVVPCLKRVRAVAKAAFSPAQERATVTQHLRSMEVEGSLAPPDMTSCSLTTS